MIDAETVAGSLWPTMPAAEATPASNALPSEESALIANLWKEPKAAAEVTGTPDVVKEARAADPAEKLWEANALYEDVISLDLEGLDAVQQEQATAAKGQIIDALSGTGLSPDAARELVMISGMEAPTPEVELKWREDSLRVLLGRNNENQKAALADLELCQRLIARDPRIQKIAEAMGKSHVFSHPRITELILDAARAERLAGRLK